MIVLLCLICTTLGILVGWYARQLLDIQRAILEIYKKLHYQNNKTAKAAVITGGHVFSQGKEQQGEVVLEDFDPNSLPPPTKGGVVRRPSPEVARAAQEKAHKDALANGE
jgi:hypothetical protein